MGIVPETCARPEPTGGLFSCSMSAWDGCSGSIALIIHYGRSGKLPLEASTTALGCRQTQVSCLPVSKRTACGCLRRSGCYVESTGTRRPYSDQGLQRIYSRCCSALVAIMPLL